MSVTPTPPCQCGADGIKVAYKGLRAIAARLAIDPAAVSYHIKHNSLPVMKVKRGIAQRWCYKVYEVDLRAWVNLHYLHVQKQVATLPPRQPRWTTRGRALASAALEPTCPV